MAFTNDDLIQMKDTCVAELEALGYKVYPIKDVRFNNRLSRSYGQCGQSPDCRWNRGKRTIENPGVIIDIETAISQLPQEWYAQVRTLIMHECIHAVIKEEPECVRLILPHGETYNAIANRVEETYGYVGINDNDHHHFENVLPAIREQIKGNHSAESTRTNAAQKMTNDELMAIKDECVDELKKLGYDLITIRKAAFTKRLTRNFISIKPCKDYYEKRRNGKINEIYVDISVAYPLSLLDASWRDVIKSMLMKECILVVKKQSFPYALFMNYDDDYNLILENVIANYEYMQIAENDKRDIMAALKKEK